MEFFYSTFNSGVIRRLSLCVSSSGFVMIFKSSSVLNFAHGELLAMGAFIFFWPFPYGGITHYLSFLLTWVGTLRWGLLSSAFFSVLDRRGADRSDIAGPRTGGHVQGCLLVIFGGNLF